MIRREEVQEGLITATFANIQAIRVAFEQTGIELIPQNGGGAGVRFKNRDAELA